MALTYKLVGFDRATEALAATHGIPQDKVPQAKTIAGIADNPAIIADWPLSRDQAGAIAGLIGTKINAGNYDWALESDTVPDRVNVERAARPVPPKIGEKPKR